MLRWKAATQHHRLAPAPLEPEVFKASTAYFKHVLEVGGYYSMPMVLFDSVVGVASSEARASSFQESDPVREATVALGEAPEAFRMDADFTSIVFFQVKNCSPEDRVHVQMPHLADYGPR